MSPRNTVDYHRGYAVWSAIAGVLFLAVAIFGRHTWSLNRIMCLAAGIFSIALSLQQFRKAKAAESSRSPRT